MTLLKQFLEPGLDCSPIDLGSGPSQGGYSCAPKGLTVLDWEDVDGIHYGRIRGCGGIVFTVNPVPAEEQHVRPLTGSFQDFLRLLLICGSTTTLGQAGDWTREQFDTYLRVPENVVTPDTQAILERIASAFRLTPMRDPFSYIKGVQASFDDDKLHYTNRYCDTLGLTYPSRREPALQGFEFEAIMFALEKE